MSIDKQKISATAQKYIRRGAWDKAIRELEKLVEADPDDVRTLLKIGNLYSRKGDDDTAARTYITVATYYRDGGFYQKAVAVYKQVIKLRPDRMDVFEALGSMYQAQGLAREAMQAYRTVLDHYKDAGDTEGFVRTLGSMCQIDPDNIALRTKYADHLARNGRVTVAVQQFNVALRLLQSSQRTTDYIKVAERLLYFRPDDERVVKDLVRVYLDAGHTRQALAKLQKLYSEQPTDTETLELLAEAFTALHERHKAASVLKELGRLYTAEYPGEVYGDDAWRRAYDLTPDDPEIHEALGLAEVDVPMLDDIVIEALDDEDLPPAQTGARRPMTREERIEETDRLLTEFDVCLRYNLLDQADEHLDALLALDPDHLETLHRRALLLKARGKIDAALVELFDVASRSWEVDKDLALALVAEIAMIEPAHSGAFRLVMSWGLDPTGYGLERPSRATAPTPPVSRPAGPGGPPPLPPPRRAGSAATSRTTSPRPVGIDLELDESDLVPLRARSQPRQQVYQTLPPDAFELVEDLQLSEEQEQASLTTFELEDFDAALEFEDADLLEEIDAAPSRAPNIVDEPDEDFASLFDVDEDDLDNLFGDSFLSGTGTDSSDFSGAFDIDPFAPSGVQPVVDAPRPAPQLTVQQLGALLEDLAEAEFFLAQGLVEDAEAMISDMRRRFGDDPRIMTIHERVNEARRAS